MAGSLGLSGPQGTRSRTAKQGIQLLVETINASPKFRLPGASSGELQDLLLQVDIQDDEDQSSKVKQIYTQLVDQGEVRFLFGPYSTSASMIAAEAVRNASVLAFLPGAAAPSIFEQGARNIFTTSPMASDLAALATEVVEARHARTIALMSDSGLFNSELCAGFYQHAMRLGLRVLANLRLDEEAVTEQVRHLKHLGPDVLVGCSHQKGAEQILISARALNFVPKAAIITDAASEFFVKSVGPAIANYVISPVPWYPALDLPCPVFGSSLGFAAKYRQKWGEEPTYLSAEAAAVGITLLSAITAAGTLDTTAVRDAMLNLDIPTFYAPLSFNPNGTRRNSSGYAVQARPLGPEFPMERYEQSAIVPVSLSSPPVLPMPIWESKELEVFPCGDGEQLSARGYLALPAVGPDIQNFVGLNDSANRTSFATDEYPEVAPAPCESCPMGRYRDPHAVTCEVCEPGRFGAEEGMTACELCPEGAACSGDGERPGLPNANFGYYKLPLPSSNMAGGLLILPCDPPELCLGNNECSGTSAGILCAECVPGYARFQFGPSSSPTCKECGDTAFNTMLIIVTVWFYSFYIWVIVKATSSACKSIRAIHSVILKICVNYLNFAGTAFEATEFKEMLVSCLGPSRASTFLLHLVTIPSVMMNPLDALSSLQCMFESVDLGMYQACILLGLIIMPLALVLKVTYTFVRKELCIQCIAPGLRACTRRLRECCRRRDMPDGSPSPGRRRRGGPGGFMSPSNVANYGLGDDITPMTPWRARASLGSISGAGPSKIVTRFVNSSIIMAFVLYPLVIRMLVVGFECVDLDVFRQKHDLSVTCLSDVHMQWIIFSTAGLVVYGFGIPLIVCLVLYAVRGRLFQDDVRKRYGFLYNGFELKYYYFESVFMVRKVIIVLFFTFPAMNVRMLLMLFTSWAFMLLHLATQPFDNRGFYCLDKLESLSLRALTMTVTARLAYDVRQQVYTGLYKDLANHWMVDTLLVSIPLLCHAWFVGFAIWSVFRNTVLKHLVVKQELWPERMTFLQRFLLVFERHRNKAYYGGEEEGRPWIDTSSLTKKEQDYLFGSLHDTLYRYMYCDGDKVHPADVDAAVQQAVMRCQRRHRRRAARLQQLYRQHASVGGFWSMILRWQGELSLALHGPGKLEQDDEPGCMGVLYGWLAEMCFLLHIRRQRAKVPHTRSPRKKGTMGDPRQQSGEDNAFSHEFMVEDFYDELMPIWQDISEGNGPRSEPSVPVVPWWQHHGQRSSQSVSSLFGTRHAPDSARFSHMSEGSVERSRWHVSGGSMPDIGGEMTYPEPQPPEARPSVLAFSSSEKTGVSIELGEQHPRQHQQQQQQQQYTPDVSTTELGEQQPQPQQYQQEHREAIPQVQLQPQQQQMQQHEHQQHQQQHQQQLEESHRQDNSSALAKRCDELLAENERLHRENETLRRRAMTTAPAASWAPSIVAEARRAVAAAASPLEGKEPPRQADERRSARSATLSSLVSSKQSSIEAGSSAGGLQGTFSLKLDSQDSLPVLPPAPLQEDESSLEPGSPGPGPQPNLGFSKSVDAAVMAAKGLAAQLAGAPGGPEPIRGEADLRQTGSVATSQLRNASDGVNQPPKAGVGTRLALPKPPALVPPVGCSPASCGSASCGASPRTNATKSPGVSPSRAPVGGSVAVEPAMESSVARASAAPAPPGPLVLPGIKQRTMEELDPFSSTPASQMGSQMGSPMPWFGAMRPADSRAWHGSSAKGPFAFIGAARPADPSAWRAGQ